MALKISNITCEALLLLIGQLKGIKLAFSPYYWEFPGDYEQKYHVFDAQSRISIVTAMAVAGENVRLEIASRYFDPTGDGQEFGMIQIIPLEDFNMDIDKFSERWLAPAAAGMANSLREKARSWARVV